MTTPITRLYDGTTATFNSAAVGDLIGLSYKIGGNWVDVTDPADANKLFEIPPQSEIELQLKFSGCHALVKGTKGTLAITASNGFTFTCPGTWQVGPCNFSGDRGAAWQSTAELRPTVPDGA
jgi:hypothetical protein